MEFDIQSGKIVVFANPKNGYKFDQEHAGEYLKKNGEYTIDYIDVENWWSRVYLKEFEGIAFNSVMFELKETTNE